MTTLLNDLSPIQHQYLISVHNCAEPVGDDKHCVFSFKAFDCLLDQPLALAVQCTGGLIKYQQFRIPMNCPRQAQALPLATT